MLHEVDVDDALYIFVVKVLLLIEGIIYTLYVGVFYENLLRSTIELATMAVSRCLLKAVD